MLIEEGFGSRTGTAADKAAVAAWHPGDIGLHLLHLRRGTSEAAPAWLMH